METSTPQNVLVSILLEGNRYPGGRDGSITCNRKPNRPLETVIQGGDYFALF